jgi:hypothetical protein
MDLHKSENLIGYDHLRFVLSEFADNLIRLALGRMSGPYIYDGDTANKLYLNAGLYINSNRSILYVPDPNTFGTTLEHELNDIVTNMLPAYKTYFVNILLRSNLEIAKYFYEKGSIFKFANNKINIVLVSDDNVFVKPDGGETDRYLLDIVSIEKLNNLPSATTNVYDKVLFSPYEFAIGSTVKTYDLTTDSTERQISRVNLILYATPDSYNCAFQVRDNPPINEFISGTIKSDMQSLIVGGYNALIKGRTYESVVKAIAESASKFNLKKQCSSMAVLDSSVGNKNIIPNLTPDLLNYFEQILASEDKFRAILFYTTPQGYMLMGSFCDATYFGYDRNRQFDQITTRTLNIRHTGGQVKPYTIDFDISTDPDLLTENLVVDVKRLISEIKTKPEYIYALKQLNRPYITTYRLQNFLVINSPNGDQFDPTIAQAGSILYLPRFISSSFVTNYSYERFTYANTFMFRIKLPINSKNWIFLNAYSEYPTEREVMINKDCYYLVTNREYLPIGFKGGYRDMLVFDLTLCDDLDKVMSEAKHSGLDLTNLSLLNVKPNLNTSFENKFTYLHPYKEGRAKYTDDLESDMKAYEKFLKTLERVPDRSIYFKEIVATSSKDILKPNMKLSYYPTLNSVPASVAAMAGGVSALKRKRSKHN